MMLLLSSLAECTGHPASLPGEHRDRARSFLRSENPKDLREVVAKLESRMRSKYVPLLERFPKCYQQFLADMKRPRARVMCRAPEEKYWYDESQRLIFKRPDARIPTYFLPESQRGIWGGEEAVMGFRQGKREPTPALWVPHVYKSVYYTEILDKYLQVRGSPTLPLEGERVQQKKIGSWFTINQLLENFHSLDFISFSLAD